MGVGGLGNGDVGAWHLATGRMVGGGNVEQMMSLIGFAVGVFAKNGAAVGGDGSGGDNCITHGLPRFLTNR